MRAWWKVLCPFLPSPKGCQLLSPCIRMLLVVFHPTDENYSKVLAEGADRLSGWRAACWQWEGGSGNCGKYLQHWCPLAQAYFRGERLCNPPFSVTLYISSYVSTKIWIGWQWLRQVEKDEPLSPESDKDEYVQIQPQVIHQLEREGGIYPKLGTFGS